MVGRHRPKIQNGKLPASFYIQTSFPLDFTPRRFVINPETSHLVMIETDHNAYTERTKQQRKLQMADEMREAAGEDEMDLANEMAEVIELESSISAVIFRSFNFAQCSLLSALLSIMPTGWSWC